MVTRVSRTEAARHFGVSISTIDRQIQRGQLSIEKEPYGIRERIWVLLDENSVADSTANAPVTAGEFAGGRPGDTTADYVMTLEHQMQSLQEIADYRQKELRESELRFQQVLSNLTHRSADHREDVQSPAGPRGIRARAPALTEMVAMAEDVQRELTPAALASLGPCNNRKLRGSRSPKSMAGKPLARFRATHQSGVLQI